MKKLITLLVILLASVAFAESADYKPFVFGPPVGQDSVSQQTEFDYMLKYKLFGRDYLTIGNDVVIQDKSGWNGTAGYMTTNARLSLGGPVLVAGDLSMGDQQTLTTGPVRANSMKMGNDNGSFITGKVCLTDPNAPAPLPNIISRSGGQLLAATDTACSEVPAAPENLSIPSITWPDTISQSIIFDNQLNGDIKTIVVPDGDGQYDIYFDTIQYKLDHQKLIVEMPDKGRLTRIFVKHFLYHDHGQIQVVYRTSDSTVRALSQKEYRGNLIIYTDENISIERSDNAIMQGTMISTKEIYLACNINFAGQLLANQLRIGDTYNGENFRFVPYNADTLDFPELNKQGGLKENDSTVIIPIRLSDTATVDVWFNYCFDLKDGVTVEDFNQPPYLPLCSDTVITTKIPVGSKSPLDTIKVNVKKDTLVEPNDILIMRIDSISGAVLPNGETSGELTIKIIDAEAAKNTSIVLDKTDTIKTYQEELRIPPGTGVVGNIKYTDDGLAPLVWTVEDPSGLFTVVDGVIKTNHVFDYETEDTVYVIKVKVVDGEFADSANYTIKITNVQEPITVTAKIDSVKENSDPGTVVGAIIGKDADSTDVTYSLNDNTNFSIDPVLGVITTKTAFDYETKKTYPITVTVTSTDGSKKDTNLVIYVQNVNEPVHANDTALTVAEKYVGPIGQVEGKDDDRQPVSYSISDSVHYSIDSLAGVISVIKPFDYNTQKTDTVEVIVTDGTFYDTAKVVVTIKNVNDPPILQPNDSLTVPENCKSCIVGIITATDPDDDPIKYTVKEPGFTIDSNGVLKLTDPLDYEKTPVVTITVIASDPSAVADTAKYTIKVTDINEPVHTKDTTCSVKENYTGKVCKVTGTDEDKTTPTFIISDTTNYSIDSTGTITIKNPIDYEKKSKDTVKVIVTDGEFADTATIVIRVLDEPETVKITEWDKETPPDTMKTNDPDHEYKWNICEGDSCITHFDNPHIHKDTTIKVCNDKKTVCDSIVVIFNDAPPVVTLTNAKSTDAYIDYITIEEQKDNNIYVNKKDNELVVTVRDTIHKTEKTFPISVKLDTVHVSSKNIKDYTYLIDETLATYTPIGGGLVEVKEVVKDGDKTITLTKIVNANTHAPIDTVQTVTYTVKQDGKELTITYKTDNLTGQRIGDYQVSYNIDSCTTVSYYLGDDKKIVKNNEGNIAYTVTYDYTDDFGNKASSKVDIIFDDIPPKVEILKPIEMESFNTNAIEVKWTVNGETQDTLTLQRLEKGVNYVIRRYVDKAGNVAADTVMVIMREAKDIDITIIHPVTEINKDKVDEFYSTGEKYDPKKPYKVTMVNPKDDSLPETIGVGFKIDIALPSVSATGNVSTLSDIIKNDKIPVDDKGNVVGASNFSIPVEEYINENCTDDFRQDYHKNGTNIPLYNVKYNLHLWIYTSNANYVNDFEINYDIDSKTEANSASIANFVIDWVPEKDGNVKAKNQHSLGTGAYLVKLYSKSTAIYRCGFKNQKAGDKITKKEYNLKSFGYKRPKK